jgi:predicted dinucleotide-binding enzyme
MKIGIIGAGNIGGTLARLFVKTGHEVALANSRGPASLQSFADELGDQLHPVHVNDAIVFGDVIVVAILWRKLDELPVYNVTGRIVVDTTNPYKDDGSFYNLGDGISSTKVMEHFQGGSVVKAFNTIWFKHLEENGNTRLSPEERRVIPIAGDDEKSKAVIGQLIEEIGFGPLDTGTLREGSRLQGVQGVLYARDLKLKEAETMIRK